jgi:hypothetical protein
MGYESHVGRSGLLLLSDPSLLHYSNLVYEMDSSLDVFGPIDAFIRIGRCGRSSNKLSMQCLCIGMPTLPAYVLITPARNEAQLHRTGGKKRCWQR